jgi:phosphoribosyl-ATP pyrophosphohydrolase/phosphoribosyl-AMP cyclohydrolase
MEINDLKFDEKGLIPAVTQDAVNGEVLMQAYMNIESLELTLSTGYATYFSRSRAKLWKKGEESGHVQKVVSIQYDCDGDCILLKVIQEGPACHTGNRSCFYRYIQECTEGDYKILFDIDSVIKDRKVNPVEGSYTNYLLTKGTDKICKKIGEESSEVIIAAKNKDKKELIMEISDLLYHTLVLMNNEGVELTDVFSELSKREGKAPESKYRDKK